MQEETTYTYIIINIISLNKPGPRPDQLIDNCDYWEIFVMSIMKKVSETTI